MVDVKLHDERADKYTCPACGTLNTLDTGGRPLMRECGGCGASFGGERIDAFTSDRCMHYDGTTREARSELLGRLELVTLDSAAGTVARMRIVLCPVCTESLRHWVAHRFFRGPRG